MWGNLIKIEYRENLKKVTLPCLVDFIWKNNDAVVCLFLRHRVAVIVYIDVPYQNKVQPL